MNFDFSEDQKVLRSQAQRFLADKAGLTAARAILEGSEPYDRKLWGAMAAMGWQGTAVPEAEGGVGLGYLELCVMAEEMGRHLCPVPFASSIYLCAELVRRCGRTDQKQRWLPGLCDGSVVATLAVQEGIGPLRPERLHTVFNSGTVSGMKWPVADGTVADLFIVMARDGERRADGSAGLYLVKPNEEAVVRETIESVDPSRDQAQISLDKAPAETLVTPEAGWDALRQAYDRAAVLIAFEQLGGAQASLDMANDYATERFAFGRPIGSFQAVKHRLADMYVRTEIARSNAYYAAWALSAGDSSLPIAAAAARIAASQAFCQNAEDTIQIHGGAGCTWEYDCHLYYRRAKHLQLILGSPRLWKDRLISELERRNAA